MIFRYGDYSHDRDEVMVRTSKTAIMDRFRRRMGEVAEYTIFGVAQVNTDPLNTETTQAALTAKLIAMRNAYALDYQNFGLYTDSGAATEHVVLNDDTFDGVKVITPPSYINGPWTGRIEYLNRRTYYIVIRAETRVGSGLYEWNERVTIRGTGGEKWAYSGQETGSPQRQGLQALTTYQYIQEGSCIGRQNWEAPPEPLFPLIEHGPQRVRVFESAKDITIQGSEMYGTGWRYVMEAIATQDMNAFAIPSVEDF